MRDIDRDTETTRTAPVPPPGRCLLCGAPHRADEPILCSVCGEPVLLWGWAP
jgi:hypothetical protein